MNGSLDVSRFVEQPEDSPRGHDSAVPTQRGGDSPAGGAASPVTDEVHRARLAVARGARDREDCTLLLDMLGLAPDEDGVPAICR
jgi:hypothetical protein